MNLPGESATIERRSLFDELRSLTDELLELSKSFTSGCDAIDGYYDIGINDKNEPYLFYVAPDEQILTRAERYAVGVRRQKQLIKRIENIKDENGQRLYYYSQKKGEWVLRSGRKKKPQSTQIDLIEET